MFTQLCLGDPWQDPDEIEEGSSSQEWCPGGGCTLGYTFGDALPLGPGHSVLRALRPKKGGGCRPLQCPFLMKLFQGLGSWVEHLVHWHLSILECLQTVQAHSSPG